jgi:hypothetical protein
MVGASIKVEIVFFWGQTDLLHLKMERSRSVKKSRGKIIKKFEMTISPSLFSLIGSSPFPFLGEVKCIFAK